MKNLTFTFLSFFLITVMIQAQSQQTFKTPDDHIEFKKKLKNYKNSTYERGHLPEHVLLPGELKSTQADFGDPPDWNWASQFGGSGEDNARDIVTDEEGNIFFTGSFSGEISVAGNTYTSIGKWDAFVAKFQSTGDFVWLKQFSASTDECIEAYGINLDNSGNIYFTGFYTGTVTIGSYTLPDFVDKNLFFAKLDSGGNVTLAKNYEMLNLYETGLVIDTDEGGNIYILGSTDGTIYWTHQSIILKYDQSGNLELAYITEQNFCDMDIYGQNIYFTGTVNFPGYIGDFYLQPVGYGDAFVAKSDLDLNFEWVYMAGHNYGGDSYSNGLYIDQNENIYITGYFRTDLILGEFELQGENGFITKCTASGDILWLKTLMEGYNDYDPRYSNICGDNNYAFVSYLDVIIKFDASNGSSIGNELLDYEPESIDFNSAENKINTTGDINQIIYISQLDELFAEQWSVEFEGNSAFAWVLSMGTDNSGNFYTYGYASNELQYFGQTIEKGLFISKQNGQGDIMWLNHFPNAYESYGYGSYMAIDDLTQSVYITGTFYEPFEIPDITTLMPGEDGSTFIIKYGLNGNYLWSVQEDFNGNDLCLAPDYSGNILLSGIFSGSINIGNTTLNSAGGNDIFISKYNTNGEFLWAIRAGGDEMPDYSGLISTDAANNIYLTGEFTSENVTVDNYPITLEEGDGNIIFAKLNAYGNVQWVTSKAGSTIEYGDWYSWPTGIKTDAEGYSYIKGWHGDSTYFDNIMLTSPYGWGYSYFIAKFDPDGNTMWANSITEHYYGFDYNQMDLDSEGSVYLGAQARDTIHFGDDFTYINEGYEDLFIAKYTTTGELDWVKTMENSESGRAWLSSVAVINEESISIGGYFIDYLNFGNSALTSNNKHGFIALIGEVSGITVYDKDSYNSLFDLFPNPSQGLINILLKEENVKVADIEITDISGKRIFNRSFDQLQNVLEIDLTGITQGVYFVKVNSGNLIGVQKLVIK